MIRHAKRSGTQAFTLIELLVVIAIIGVLAALLLPAISQILLAARGAKTSARLQNVLRQVSTLGGGGEGDEAVPISEILHVGIAGITPSGSIPGVRRWKLDQRVGERVPVDGTWIAPPWPPYVFAHPWGKQPTDLPGDAPDRLPEPDEILVDETRSLDDFTARFSAEILAVIGLLPPDDPGTSEHEGVRAYRSDRSPDQHWNDAWGNPLLVGFALYHPRQNSQITSGGAVLGRANYFRNRPDLFVRRAVDTYGYFRAVYLAPAAIGPILPATTSDSDLVDPNGDWSTQGSGILDQAWDAVMDNANRRPDGTPQWVSDGTTDPPRDPLLQPPWTGVRKGNAAGMICWLHAPMEFK